MKYMHIFPGVGDGKMGERNIDYGLVEIFCVSLLGYLKLW